MKEAPWVLVTGDVVRQGGQDRANFELAHHLLSQGRNVHLVAHRVDAVLSEHPLVRVHWVKRPAGKHLLGQPLLDAKGRRVAAQVVSECPTARVVVNGGNCQWPDINWVHSLHACWPVRDEGAPLWMRAKNRITKALAKRAERRALHRARLIVANSKKTAADVGRALKVTENNIRVVPLGVDPQVSQPRTPLERHSARARLGFDATALVVLFVGALGSDCNKGLDTLLAAWAQLCRAPDFPGVLLVAGEGAGDIWHRRAETLGLQRRVRWLGRCDNIAELQAAADLAVCPSRYEAFGLFAFESLCRGLPVLVSASSGVVEHYPPALSALLLEQPEDSAALALRILHCARELAGYERAVSELGARLSLFTWARMGEAFVDAVCERPR